jgi:hypothetical protein
LLGIQRSAFSNGLRNLFKIDLMIRGKHCHQVLFSGFYHHNLCMVPRFHVLGLGDPLCRNSFGMMQNFVPDFAFVQTIDELLWYLHN